jgi:Rrf2 family nitric oxide-sensitive transcriptional repressor
MQLSKFSDYALRATVLLASDPERLISTRHIAEVYDAKYFHMAKVTGWLVANGFMVSLRGRGGGLRLAQKPSDISLGTLLRKLEADRPIVDTSRDADDKTPELPQELVRSLSAAQDAFFRELDPVTIADIVAKSPNVSRLIESLDATSAQA